MTSSNQWAAEKKSTQTQSQRLEAADNKYSRKQDVVAGHEG